MQKPCVPLMMAGMLDKGITLAKNLNYEIKIIKILFICYLIKLSLVEVIHKHTKYSFDVHVLIHF